MSVSKRRRYLDGSTDKRYFSAPGFLAGGLAQSWCKSCVALGPALAALTMQLAIAGCITTAPLANPADQLYDNRDFAAAAAAYEISLEPPVASLEAGDRLMFRLGLSLALAPGRQQWQRAGEWFSRLIDSYPESQYRPAAELFLALGEDLDRLRSAVRTRTLFIERLIEGSRALQESLAELEERKNREINLLDRQLTQLSRQFKVRAMELAESEQQLERLREELEQLKRIDTKLSQPLN